MTYHDDELVASFLAAGPQHARADALNSTFAGIRTTPQRPAWFVRAMGGTIDTDPSIVLRLAPLVATLALVGIIAGALIVGIQRPSPEPTPIVVPSASPDASEPPPSPSVVSAPLGLVAFEVIKQLDPGQGDCVVAGAVTHGCSVLTIWTANTDGSGARPMHPDAVRSESIVRWTADGSQLFYVDANGLALADPDGNFVQRWAGDICPGPCGDEWVAGSLSPDGTRVAYVHWASETSNVIAILDLETGEVTELEATRTTNPPLGTCHLRTDCVGTNEPGIWSPDGTRLAFGRNNMSPEAEDTWTSYAVYVVNADDTGLQRVTPVGWSAAGPRWSADGTRLLVVHVVEHITADGLSTTPELDDVWTIGTDGSDLVQLTDDGHSRSPAWTTDGRVTFTRVLGSGATEDYENWIVDADGANATRLPESLEALTSAGCISCLYPGLSAPESPRYGLWQP